MSLDWAHQYKDYIVALQTVRDEKSTLEQLEVCYKEFPTEKTLLFWLTRNPNLSEELIVKVFNENRDNISLKFNIALHDKAPVNILQILEHDSDENIHEISKDRLKELRRISINVWDKK